MGKSPISIVCVRAQWNWSANVSREHNKNEKQIDIRQIQNGLSTSDIASSIKLISSLDSVAGVIILATLQIVVTAGKKSQPKRMRNRLATAWKECLKATSAVARKVHWGRCTLLRFLRTTIQDSILEKSLLHWIIKCGESTISCSARKKFLVVSLHFSVLRGGGALHTLNFLWRYGAESNHFIAWKNWWSNGNTDANGKVNRTTDYTRI